MFSSLTPSPYRPIINLNPISSSTADSFPSQRNLISQMRDKTNIDQTSLLENVAPYLYPRHYSEQFPPLKSDPPVEGGVLPHKRGHENTSAFKEDDMKQCRKSEKEDLKEAKEPIPEDASIEQRNKISPEFQKTLREHLKEPEQELMSITEGEMNSGKWTDEEHKKFLEGL